MMQSNEPLIERSASHVGDRFMDFSYMKPTLSDDKFVKKVLKKIAYLSQDRRYRNSAFRFIVPVVTMEDILQQRKEKIGAPGRCIDTIIIEPMLHFGSLVVLVVSMVFMVLMTGFGMSEFNDESAPPTPDHFLSFSCRYGKSSGNFSTKEGAKIFERYNQLLVTSGQSSFHDKTYSVSMIMIVLSFALLAAVIYVLNSCKNIVMRVHADWGRALDKTTRIDACLYFIDILKEAGETTERELGATIPTGTILCNGSLFESANFKKAYDRFIENLCFEYPLMDEA